MEPNPHDRFIPLLFGTDRFQQIRPRPLEHRTARRARRHSGTSSIWLLLWTVVWVSVGWARSENDAQRVESRSTTGSISGQVTTNDGAPLDRVNITVKGTAWGATSIERGTFRIRDLPPGAYAVTFDHIGYAPRTRESIVVVAGQTTKIGRIILNPAPIPLDEVVVSPGTYSMMGQTPGVRRTLSSEDIKMMGWAEDVTRAVQRIPGTSSDEYSAQFSIRGGEPDEVLVLLDGMQIYKPFHQKDFGGGLFSSIDIEAIDNVNLLTGGFGADYGDRMSGVLNMQTKTARPGQNTTSVGMSLMNFRGFSMGSFGYDPSSGKPGQLGTRSDGLRGTWLISARRAYLDILNRLMGNSFKLRPNYYDLLGKVEFELHPKHELRVHGFLANDAYELNERVVEPGTDWTNIDHSDTAYGNGYGWLTLDSHFSNKVYLRSLAFGGRVSQRRDWEVFDNDPQAHLNSATIHDKRHLNLFGAKFDMSLHANARTFFKTGLDLRTLSTDYDYSKDIRNEFITAADSLIIVEDSFSASPSPKGAQIGAYTTGRFLLTSRLALETGLRYDDAEHTGDQIWSPRLGMSLSVTDQTVLRAAWGHYHQVQGIDDLDVQFGQTEFQTAEKSEHYVLGVEHEFRSGLHARVEAYYKEMTNVRDSYYSFRDIDEFFPEARDDLVRLVVDRADSRGIELLLKHQQTEQLSWWLSYVIARAQDDVIEIDYDGRLVKRTGWLPRAWDQRHTLNADVNYRLNEAWQFNFAFKYRTGWPSTPFSVGRKVRKDGSFAYYHDRGVFRGDNVPAYQRLDTRINRHFSTSRGRISTFLHIINLYNHTNVIRYDHDILEESETGFRAEIGEEEWFGIIPFLGVSWEF